MNIDGKQTLRKLLKPVGSLRQRSWLDRTATRRKKRERVFEMLGLPERFTWGKDRDIIIL